LQPRRWLVGLSLVCFGGIGLALGIGLLVAAGLWEVPRLEGHTLPCAESVAWLGLLPIAAAVAAFCWMRRERRMGSILSVAAAAVVMVAGLASFGPGIADRSRAAKPLVAAMQMQQVEREVQIGCHPSFYRPGVVFYSRREVQRLMTDQQALDLLRSPLQAYLLIAAPDWQRLAPQMDTNYRIVERQRDVTAGKEILLITNRPPPEKIAQ
jgi:hypothetical protein